MLTISNKSKCSSLLFTVFQLLDHLEIRKRNYLYIFCSKIASLDSDDRCCDSDSMRDV